MCRRALLNSPVLACRSSFSNLLYSSPYLRLWHMEFSKSCQLNFPKSLSHRVKLLLSHSFWLFYAREKTSWEKKRKELKLQCGEKNRDYLGGSYEFSVWCGSKSLILFPGLTFLFSQYLMLIFKVTVMKALEKVWKLVLFFSPVCF